MDLKFLSSFQKSGSNSVGIASKVIPLTYRTMNKGHPVSQQPFLTLHYSKTIGPFSERDSLSIGLTNFFIIFLVVNYSNLDI